METQKSVFPHPRVSQEGAWRRGRHQALKVEDKILSVGKTGKRTVDSQRGPRMHRNRVKNSRVLQERVAFCA